MLIAREDFTADAVGFDTKSEGTGEIKDFSATFSVPYDPAQTSYRFQYYFGPNQYTIMRSYDMKAWKKSSPWAAVSSLLINTGLTINVFNWLSKFISNYGIIILILTVIIKLIILPLTYKSYMSSAKMRVLQPQAQRDKRTLSQPGGCAQETAGGHGTLQEVRREPHGRLYPHADTDAYPHRHVPFPAGLHRVCAGSTSCGLRTSLPMTVSCNCPLKFPSTATTSACSPCSWHSPCSSTRA